MTEEQANNLSKRRRIFELDLLRGFFVVIIIIDHLQLWPSPLRYLTGEGRLWVTAAEGFFLISGLLVGYIRGFKNKDKSLKDISIKLTKENIYDRHFNIQLGNFELLYENAVYLELILSEMRHRLIHDMIFMIYDYHYYKPKCDNYYFYRTETPIDDIDRNDFEELIIWFLENKHRYKINKYFRLHFSENFL